MKSSVALQRHVLAAHAVRSYAFAFYFWYPMPEGRTRP
jgi:hypothetical protein